MEEECPSQFKEVRKYILLMKLLIAFGFRANPADWFKDFKIKTDQAGLVVAPEKQELKFQTI